MLSVRQPLRTSLSLGVAQLLAGCLKSAFSCMTLYYTAIQVSTAKCHSLTSPLKEEDCARARLTRCAGALVSWTALSLLSLKDSLAEGAGEKRQIEKSGKGIVPGKNGRLQRPSQ